MSATLPIMQHTAIARPDMSGLRRLGLLKDLDSSLLTRIAGFSEVFDVPEDGPIARQGEPADAVYVVVVGQVALSSATSDGASAVVEVVRPGGHFFLPTVLARLPLLMSANAVGASQVIKIAAAELLALVQAEPALATALLQAQAMEFRAMVRQVCDLKLRTTAQRLGCYLLALSKDRDSHTASLRQPFDKRLLAARLGCRQENLSRAFAALRDLGVETHGARVILHDIPRLREYAVPDELDDAEYA